MNDVTERCTYTCEDYSIKYKKVVLMCSYRFIVVIVGVPIENDSRREERFTVLTRVIADKRWYEWFMLSRI